MILTKYFLILLSFIRLGCCCEQSISRILKDFLDVDEIPTKISAFGCWNNYTVKNRKYLVELLKEHPVSFQRVSGLIQVHQPTHQQLFLLDSNCIGYKNVLENAQNLKLFKFPFRWIFIGNERDVPVWLDILVDSRFYIVTKLSPQIYKMKSIYKISKYSDKFFENDVAHWNDRFLYCQVPNLIKNRHDLMGLIVNVSYVITNIDSLNHLWDYRDKHIDTISKLNFLSSKDVLHIINATGNFSVTNTWGYKNVTTGIYSGMVGDLQTGKADLGGTAVFFTVDRLSILEYIMPTPTFASFLFRAPPLSYVKNVFTLPFSKGVWHASFLLVAVICMIIYAITKWEWEDKEFEKSQEIKHSALLPDFMEVVVLGLGAICQQGSETEPRSTAGKIATLFAFIALMFLYTSYSANIVALLQSTSNSINTVDDLLYSRIKLGVEIAPYTKHYFEASSDEVRKAIYYQKIAPKGSMINFMDIQTGIKRVREEFFAFHIEESKGYKVISETFHENEKCGLKGIRFWQVIEPFIAIAKNTTYKELFKYGFRKIQETGVISREYRKLYVRKPVCQGMGSNFMSVGLIDCYYAFLIFGIGCVISLILLVMERFVYKKSKRIVLILKASGICPKNNGFDDGNASE